MTTLFPKFDSSDRHTNGRTDRRTSTVGRYQLHYLSRFAVDNKITVDEEGI